MAVGAQQTVVSVRRAPAAVAAPHHVVRRPVPVATAAAVRPRLRLGAANDEAEHQADRIAHRVLRGPAASAPAASPGPGQAAAVRRALAGRPGGAAAEPAALQPSADEQCLPASLEERLLALQRAGQPLPEGVRRDLEARFGMDFAAVRIHTDEEAAQLNDAVGAHAFALGEHIAFNRGRFRPDEPAGRQLLAHELAHVTQHRAQAAPLDGAPAVRRGFWSDLYDSAAATLGDIADWAWDQVQSVGWTLVRTVSPELERTLRAIQEEGLLAWLGRQVARAWDAYIGTLRALVPFEGPRQLIDLYAGLVERAAAIAVALASGNCAPLLAAIADLKGFVVETVGVAWERLADFLRPIGEFFTGLWNDFAAPALEWLQQFGGEVWAGIQDLGRRLWAWIAPLRDAAERIWTWFSELLFGPAEDSASGASEGGVVGWIGRKAGEAWDWVKERSRPVWQPVADMAARVAELIPPAFVREMGESARQLATQLDGAGDGLGGAGEGDAGGVAENRDTLAALLPSVEGILAGVRRIIVGAGAWLTERIAALGALVAGLIGRLQANVLLSWLGGAFDWLAGLLDTLTGWARDQVAAVFALLVRGFDALSPFLQMVLEAVRKVIDIYANLLQLPALIVGNLWRRLPECIRVPIEEFVQTQILARIPVFGQFVADPQLWPRLQATALRLLRRVFVDGDLLGVAWEFFQAALRLIGLPPELVVQVLAKAAQALGDILVNPIGFLLNLVRAMVGGFQGFFAHIGRHLLDGVTGWLFGAVREAGVEPPADFSLRSVLGFVMDVLGITAANLFARLGRRLDPQIIEKLKTMQEVAGSVWSFVTVLATEGPAGLWRLLSERLSNLWTTVLEGVISFVTTRVIAWASLWLLSFVDWTGITGFVTTCLSIYRAIVAFADYLREMLEIVSRVLDGVVGIATGSIEIAAGFLEDALARSLPVAIGFLAYQAGLGRLSQRLAEILGALRERIDAAIDWLIDQGLRLGQALIDLARRGVGAVRGAVGRLREWWRERIGFRAADGRDHELYFRGEGASAELMIASEPQGFTTFLRSLPDSADKTRAGELFRELQDVQRQPTAANPTSGAGTPSNDAQILRLTNELAQVAARLMSTDAEGVLPASAPTFDPLERGFGAGVKVERLTRQIPPGSEPGIGSPIWNVLNKRMVGNGNYYIRGHLLNHHIGGSGMSWANLAPITGSANTTMSGRVEEPAKKAVLQDGATLRYEVKAVYPRSLTKNTALIAEITRLAGAAALTPELAAKKEVIEAEQALPDHIVADVDRLLPSGEVDTSYADRRHGFVVPNEIGEDSLDQYHIDGVDYDPQAELRALELEARNRLAAQPRALWSDFRRDFKTRIVAMIRAGVFDDPLRRIFGDQEKANTFAIQSARVAALTGAAAPARLNDVPTWDQFIGVLVAYDEDIPEAERLLGDVQIEALRTRFDDQRRQLLERFTGALTTAAAAAPPGQTWRKFYDDNTLIKLGSDQRATIKAAFDQRGAGAAAAGGADEQTPDEP